MYKLFILDDGGVLKYTFSGSVVSQDACGNFAEICFKIRDGGISWEVI